MGTRGFYVYPHKGRYYIYHNHWDSDLDGPSPGLDLLEEIPGNVSKEEFEEWLRKTREYVYAQHDIMLVLDRLNDPEPELWREYVSDEQPEYDHLGGRMGLQNRLSTWTISSSTSTTTNPFFAWTTCHQMTYTWLLLPLSRSVHCLLLLTCVPP